MTVPAMPLETSHPLAARTHADDDRAFVALVERYQPLVYRWAVALTGDGDVAEDVTQETFVRVHRKLATFRGDGPFEGWLYRIVRRVALRAARPGTHAAPSTVDNVYLTDPGARVDRQRAVEIVRAIATALPLRQREVFILCDLEGRSPAEVAAILGMKDVSVRASLFKARASIRREILITHPAFREHLP
jgi:RNA polymerase sigma-70 factor (ECF subfamily)